MSKLAIISRPDRGVLIDMSGCQSIADAVEQLNSNLQLSDDFLQGQAVDINLGTLSLTQAELAQVLLIVESRGVEPREVLSFDQKTRASIDARRYTTVANLEFKAQRGAPSLTAQTRETTFDPESGAPAPSVVPTTSVHQLPTINVTFAAVQEGVGNDSESPGTVTVDTTADRIIMVESSEPVEIGAPLPAVAEQSLDRSHQEVQSLRSGTLHVRQTLRSGQAISTPGNLVLIGDVNAGAEVIAGGDITVWGVLRGIAHAGVGGKHNAEIRALKLDPIQIRIGSAIARSPDQSHVRSGLAPGPETARLVDGQIRITRSYFE
jgi:septum site-determining protein MinC